MTEPLNNVATLAQKAKNSLAAVTNAAELEAWRVQYIGRKGAIPALLREVKNLSAEAKKTVGQEANQLRIELEQLFQTKKAELEPSATTTTDTANLPAGPGHLHPLTLTIRRIQNIFAALGFQIVEGPEVEEQKYNFDLLNIPPEHPARAETDTFYIANQQGSDGLPLMLRTHTSPVQIRAVQANNLTPPFKILAPGRVFRSEKSDATHESTFYQFEGLVVSETTSIADFKGTIETFFSTFFAKDVKARLRPSYFPFVEPGFEVDISCVFCQQAGCRVCKYSGWIEVMGAGMVHPNVLINMGLDPAKYQGFAFGGAVDRLTMLRNSIGDIRLFWSGDIRFLRQF